VLNLFFDGPPEVPATLSALLPVAIPVLLVLGGTYLCFEGAEKVAEIVRPHHHDDAPEATAAFEARWPVASSRRVWGLGIGLAVLLGALLLTDYGQGRTVYSGLASYHAYLEFPVLLVLLTRWRGLHESVPGH